MAKVRTVRDIMTHTVATVPPDATLVEAAKLMSDLNIGNVVVSDNGKPKGIITDRDITVRAVADGEDVRVTPVKKYMTDTVVTGRLDWSVDKVADTMSKHQIRRLPIVENDQVVGIISLGDVARHEKDKGTVAGSLREISEPAGLHRSSRGIRQLMGGMLLAMLMGSAVSFLFISKTGRELREQLQDEISQRNWSETALNLLEEVRDRLDEISNSLNDVQPRRRLGLFR